MKKIKQVRTDQNKLKDLIESAFLHVENRDRQALMRLLDNNSSIPIVDIIDSRGYTLMHMICFKNIEEMGVFLMEKVNQTVTKEQVLVWINHRTDEDGFTALHFASFRGNLSMINLLLQNGSDMYIKNNYGINVLHVAAQGDQPISLYFFKNKGMDIRSKDNRNSTPLHWACYSKSEIALCYLLSWV